MLGFYAAVSIAFRVDRLHWLLRILPAMPYSGLSFPYSKATPINVFSEKVLTAFSASIMAFRSASRRERVVL